ncbi:MAG: hypothetical protein HY289_09070 [Planctomycetes bacterium]|nr:hypothetical protein [Planctomycetota bacterium]
MPTIQEINRELADKIVIQAQGDPRAFGGKFVGLANGQIVIATDDLDELDRRLGQAEPDAARTYIVEIGLDTSKVHEIWSPQQMLARALAGSDRVSNE